MSKDAAAERGSQPAQRDELAHPHTVPNCGGVSPPTNVTPPTVTTRVFGSLQRAQALLWSRAFTLISHEYRIPFKLPISGRCPMWSKTDNEAQRTCWCSSDLLRAFNTHSTQTHTHE